MSERVSGLLTEERYDWDGTHAFDEHGQVDIARSTGPVNLATRPLPAIGPKTRAELVEAEAVFEEALRPATRMAFAAHLSKLALHYPQQFRDPSLLAPMLDDYWHDIGHLPEAVLVEACNQYRDSGEKWFPRAKQLADLAYPHMRRIERLRRRAAKLLEKPYRPRTRQPAPPGQRTLGQIMAALTEAHRIEP